jgi:hypothetical protein
MKEHDLAFLILATCPLEGTKKANVTPDCLVNAHTPPCLNDVPGVYKTKYTDCGLPHTAGTECLLTHRSRSLLAARDDRVFTAEKCPTG